MPEDDGIVVYQLKIRLKYISPMIWRRLLVRSDTTIADLHHYLQIVIGWDDDHAHQFAIRGVHYGISYVGGVSYAGNAREIKLSDFRFYINDRFLYEYNFLQIPWESDIRLEKRLPLDPNKAYPVCIGGQRGAPPEDCGGSSEFIELEEHYQPLNIIFELEKAYDEDLDEELNEEKLQNILDNLEEWHDRPKFDRCAINDQLQKHVSHNKVLVGGSYESDSSSCYRTTK